jgi:predicted NAD/FAD-binding protein
MPSSTNAAAFVVKWLANGTLAGYSAISGSSSILGYGIAVDSSQNIYITGQYSSTTTVQLNTFGTAPVASGFSMPITTNIDAFVIKWNP